jgi:transposase-like protein
MDKIDKLIEELGMDKHIPNEIQQNEFLLSIFKKGPETLMEGEMDQHLGYEKNDRNLKTLKRENNKRNGHRERPMNTSAGKAGDRL